MLSLLESRNSVYNKLFINLKSPQVLQAQEVFQTLSLIFVRPLLSVNE